MGSVGTFRYLPFPEGGENWKVIELKEIGGGQFEMTTKAGFSFEIHAKACLAAIAFVRDFGPDTIVFFIYKDEKIG